MRRLLVLILAMCTLFGMGTSSASATPYSVQGPIGALYASQPATMGKPQTPEKPSQGGTWQRFERGIAYQWQGNAFFVRNGPIRDRFRATGAEHGVLGFPTTPDWGLSQYRGARYQSFQGGRIVMSDRGTYELTGGIDMYWRQQGWERGFLQVPTSSPSKRSWGWYQHFAGGTVYDRAGASTVTVRWGSIMRAWQRLGKENGQLGLPTSEQYRPSGNRQGLQQNFEYGVVSQPRSGGAAYAIGGPFAEAWKQQGWDRGRLGQPVADATCVYAGESCYQKFERGIIFWNALDGTHVKYGSNHPLQYRLLNSQQRLCYGKGELEHPELDCRTLLQNVPLRPDREARADDTERAFNSCYTYARDTRLRTCVRGDVGASFRIALVGNSRMATYRPLFEELLRGRGVEIHTFIGNGCVLTLAPNTPNCRERLATQQRALIDRGDFDMVILTGGNASISQPEVEAQLRAIANNNKKVVIIQDNPGITVDGDACVSRSSDAEVRAGACDPPSVRAAFYRNENYWQTRGKLPQNVYYVGTGDLFCNDSTCPVVIGGIIVYTDNIHLTMSYQRQITPVVSARIAEVTGESRFRP